MARCDYCNQKIKTGERFILEGQYPNLLHVSIAQFARPEFFGTVFHATCFYERFRPKTPRARTKIIVREGEAKKRCPQCGTEFSVDFNFCPNCGGFERPP